MIKSISIIFPIYNEEKRLKYCFKNILDFNKISFIKNIEYIFVDDGSLDSSLDLIKQFSIDNSKSNKTIKYKIIKNIRNKGKGSALAKGISMASKEWLLTIDTDISVSLLELNKWKKNEFFKKNYKIYFGSRNLKNSNVRYKIHRKIIGSIFILICKLLFNINLHDTQCGFKLYKKEVGKKIFGKIVDEKFAHDIEIVLIARKYKIKIIELPVKWVHKNEGKINLITDSLNMLVSLIKMKINSKIS